MLCLIVLNNLSYNAGFTKTVLFCIKTFLDFHFLKKSRKVSSHTLELLRKILLSSYVMSSMLEKYMGMHRKIDIRMDQYKVLFETI